jgi:hypothetical protein
MRICPSWSHGHGGMHMKTKIYWIGAAVMILLIQNIAADGLSVQLKRTNPGIANTKSAELIFDIVNMDFGYQVEGFLLCRSPDDVTVSSSLGAGSGSGAQYISPKFEINNGPSQKYLSLVIDSEIEGDMRTGCILKYIPFTETVVVTGSYFDELANQTLNSTKATRTYQLMNGATTTTPEDRDYRELRLDKTVPFAKKQMGVSASCPDGQTTCTSDEIVVSKDWFMYGFIALLVLVILGVAYLLGRGSKN